MTPILFPATATTYTTKGIGTLGDAMSCTVTQERNGSYELELAYPITGVHFGHISQRSIILTAPNDYDAPQPFRVYRISRPINGVVTIYARHISYDLAGYPIAPYSASTAQAAISGLSAHSMLPMPFTFSTNLSKAGIFTVSAPTSARALLGGSEGSLLDIYGGEWRFDGYNVQLLDAIGADRGVKIVYGVNLTDLEQEENCEAVYTGIVPYYIGTDTPAVWGSVLIALPDADYTKILPVDLSGEFDAPPTVAQLNAAGRNYLQTHNITTPTVSLSVSFVALRGTSAYNDAAPLEEVRLGDTVTVRFPRLGVDAKAKVVKTVYNCLTERLDKVEIGSIRTSIADTIAASIEEIKKKPNASVMKQAILSATAQITGAKGGYVVTRYNAAGLPYELLILDAPTITAAKNVWRWNSGGFGHSSTGYNGPYTTAITQNGQIVADFITTGTLSADRIYGGTIDAENINVKNINGQNIKAQTVKETQLGDGAAVNRVISTNAVNNRCISSGSIATTTCNSEIQGYFADVIETQKLYAGTASVNYLRANIIKGNGFAFSNSGTAYQLQFNGVGAAITAGNPV